METEQRIKGMFDRSETSYLFKSKPGLSKETVELISKDKNEPEWMLQKRMQAFEIFEKMPIPDWGPNLENLHLDKLTYYAKPDAKKNAKKWEDLPESIRSTFEKLGIPEAEKKALGGVGAQWESQVVYHNLKKNLEEKGVIFCDMDVAVQEYPELVKKYFMKCVPVNLHKFAALHGSVWSGGSFIYVPKNVKVDLPLQAYFRVNEEKMGQFEHTLIIADEGAEVSYIEGCSSSIYSLGTTLHAGCVELFVHKNARIRYTSVESWAKNVFNLNTKRAIVYDNGTVDWINGNTGSGVTMLYPCSMLVGKNARSDYLGIAFAGKGQIQDTGCKVYHLAPNTSSTIKAKSISKDGGITTYRGVLKINKGATNSKSNVQCDALMMDNISKSNTVPNIEVNEDTADIGHEATVGKISGDQIFYLMSRGLTQEEATKLIVSGFIEPIVRELPIEYAVELNRLIELEIEGSLG